MKTVVIIFLSFFSFFAPDIDVVRQQFEQAQSSKEATESLYKSLESYTKSDPLMLAYKGASEALKARLLTNRAAKKKMVVQGIKRIEGAVKADPKKIEIRLVRLAIQENSPKILKYKMNIDEDKQLILANFVEQPSVVKNMIRRYAKQSKVFTSEERAKLAA